MFGKSDVVRQWWIAEKRWLVDFRIKSVDTYIQFDGVFWHGGDGAAMKRLYESNRQLHDNIMKAKSRDAEQDQWFAEQGLTLVRITDEEFSADRERVKLMLEGVRDGNVH